MCFRRETHPRLKKGRDSVWARSTVSALGVLACTPPDPHDLSRQGFLFWGELVHFGELVGFCFCPKFIIYVFLFRRCLFRGASCVLLRGPPRRRLFLETDAILVDFLD